MDALTHSPDMSCQFYFITLAKFENQQGHFAFFRFRDIINMIVHINDHIVDIISSYGEKAKNHDAGRSGTG